MTESPEQPRSLAPEVQAQLDAGRSPNFDIADVAARRVWLTEEIDRMFTLFGAPGPEMAQIRDHEVAVHNGNMLVRSYHPLNGGSSPATLPAHVMLHGGGWTTGSINELVIDAQARHRAAVANCVVITVEYRLAPEYRFPTAVHDSVHAVRWVRANAVELGIDPDVITLGGGSAGGNLAAAAVVADPGLALRALILEVPACDLRPRSVADDSVRADPRFAPTEMAMVALVLPEYLGDVALAESPLASPVLADVADLAAFPETHILTAELDLLRPGAERFAVALLAAGVPVTITCYAGALHGSPLLTGTWDTARRWHDDVLATLNDIHRRARATD